ncbi:hypothetical protein WN48_08188 [Eufriesea mexicana]|uniref:Uncharacterized protein n=1 Tax=Eufriesea mexicana TaxID=516756 RepID=A0A310S835_9HYME|nr:hypothetical protein WN48_08188 [Eufriesea mexicana]
MNLLYVIVHRSLKLEEKRADVGSIVSTREQTGGVYSPMVRIRSSSLRSCLQYYNPLYPQAVDVSRRHAVVVALEFHGTTSEVTCGAVKGRRLEVSRRSSTNNTSFDDSGLRCTVRSAKHAVVQRHPRAVREKRDIYAMCDVGVEDNGYDDDSADSGRKHRMPVPMFDNRRNDRWCPPNTHRLIGLPWKL